MGWGMRGDYNLGIACSGRSLDGTAGLVLGGDRKGRRRLGEAAERKGSSHRWAMVGRKEQGSRSKRMYDERAWIISWAWPNWARSGRSERRSTTKLTTDGLTREQSPHF
jgi:hypothetical protein